MLTRRMVVADATRDPNEVLVTFDDDGIPRNELLRNQAALRVQLLTGDRAAGETLGFEVAEAAIAARTEEIAAP